MTGMYYSTGHTNFINLKKEALYIKLNIYKFIKNIMLPYKNDALYF